ncbi:iron uptake protein [Luteimonas sp. SDU101]|uniref:iron uptake protein n=1 Tax=Luteimonas sp. SDU101 TaxID=3422593 RepID=UPI003EBE4E19
MSQVSTTFLQPRAARWQLVARVGAAVFGGYAFAWGFVAAGASLMFAAGMGFHDAEFLASLLGVLGFLVVFLWAVAAKRPWRAWLWLLGIGGGLALVASLVQAALL